MELMSFLLLYTTALSAGLVEARFGIVRGNYVLNKNRTFLVQKESRNLERKIHLKDMKHSTSYQDIFSTIRRKHCLGCTECVLSVMQAQKNKYHLNEVNNYIEETGDHFERSSGETDHLYHRIKREDRSSEQLVASKKKKNKGKRSKEQRLATLFEYKIAGDVYALKAKNSHRNQTNDREANTDTCKIYKVVRAFPCDSADGESLLAFAKKNSKKKGKSDLTTTEKVAAPTTTDDDDEKQIKSPSRKRHVDYASGVAPENYMPSIEDMFNKWQE